VRRGALFFLAAQLPVELLLAAVTRVRATLPAGGEIRRRGIARHVQVVGIVEVQRLRQLRVLEVAQRLPVRLRAVGDLRLFLDRRVDAAALLGDLGEVAHAAARDEHGRARFLQRGVEAWHPVDAGGRKGGRVVFPHVGVRSGRVGRMTLTPILLSRGRRIGAEVELRAQQAAQVREHPGHARIVELARDGRVDRDVLVLQLERDAVALPLLAHVAQRVLGAALVELVEHDELGEVEHVDLLELARRAVVARHHVHRKVDEVDDLRITLADAGGFDDDEVVALPLEERDAVLEHDARRRVLAARRHRAHEHAMAAQRVHADAVAEQRAAGAATRRIDREHGNAHLRECLQEAQHEFVDDRGLAGAAGAGDADDGRSAPAGVGILESGMVTPGSPFLAQLGEVGFAEAAVLDGGEDSAHGDLVVDVDERGRVRFRPFPVPYSRFPAARRARHDVLDHRDEAHVHAVVRMVDALDAVGLQLADLFRRDRAAAAAEHADVARPTLPEHVDHVLEVLDMATLVARQRDRVGVFLQRGAHDVLDRTVVAEVDDFRTLRLDQPPHDVDRGVVSVEQAGRGDEAQRRLLGRSLVEGKIPGGRAHRRGRLGERG
jgi:hypothetical protein